MNDVRQVSFTRMDQGTREDYALLDEIAEPYVASTGDRVLADVDRLKEGLLGYPVDRYQHSLQTATRALRAGECEEMVVAALLHDIGDVLAPENHSAIAAAVLAPFVAEYTTWVVANHGLFQGYYYFDKIGKNKDERERYREHPAFEMTERFCSDYDQRSFDPDYDTLPIEAFQPMVKRIFARKAWGQHSQQKWPARM